MNWAYCNFLHTLAQAALVEMEQPVEKESNTAIFCIFPRPKEGFYSTVRYAAMQLCRVGI